MVCRLQRMFRVYRYELGVKGQCQIYLKCLTARNANSSIILPRVFIIGTVMVDLILYVPSTIFQLYRDGSSWVEQVLSDVYGVYTSLIISDHPYCHVVKGQGQIYYKSFVRLVT